VCVALDFAPYQQEARLTTTLSSLQQPVPALLRPPVEGCRRQDCGHAPRRRHRFQRQARVVDRAPDDRSGLRRQGERVHLDGLVLLDQRPRRRESLYAGSHRTLRRLRDPVRYLHDLQGHLKQTSGTLLPIFFVLCLCTRLHAPPCPIYVIGYLQFEPLAQAPRRTDRSRIEGVISIFCGGS
jgi:hypothetical protein